MRIFISAIVISAAVAFPAVAQVTFMDKQKVFAACMKSRLSAVRPTYEQMTTSREVCNHVVDEKFAGMTEIPRESLSVASPTSDYDMEAFLLKERMNRDLEAIDRDYELRRSGVLP